ncbi:branched-chain amino acid ABC transporter permease [Brevibacillus sp. HB1.2]|uniref:Branched-chain amino acid ABC transporter permease n=1 Tax=Brevibacillus porteri TaxID=2126350 RepID=A0ABX5FQN8_9BACL|nr:MULTISPECIES: branched-chain amino acid ABC transporter permease [Brevibacillus]MED1800546.1 branched-chain amino acid ABC transporter permease [Brevibacillus porteri]MED2132729.1 branched-chain amino acid ABC transporter permease [Brevibacillus porteri]MED2743262.1 branched-chain amino acid ABC transporter permease [Brevibacillus porteri]MED2816212.1 branched-chain amino acid ABC transporter permease [Brevibacillus porteri]MED2894054.1 branched-chain amino acid ABC transporter permease [Br
MANLAWKSFKGIPLVFTLIWIVAFSAALYLMDKSVIAFLGILSSIVLVYYTNTSKTIKMVIGAIVLLLIIPLVAGENRYYMEVASQVGIYVAMALGLNIVVGFAGLLDLGYVAFFAAGAYAYAIFSTSQANEFIAGNLFPLSGEWFWPFLIVGLIVAAVFGILLGLPVLRVKGDYLAIVTLGFGEIIRIVFNNLDKPINITNGPQGITPIPSPELFGIKMGTPFYFYFIVLFVIAFIVLANIRFEHSRLGRAWIAVREDELAAQSMGISLLNTKLAAFALGASFAGVVGVIFAAKQTFIDPTSFTLMESIGILVMVILGGSGSIPGVVLGAAFVTILQVQLLKEFSNFLHGLQNAGIISLPNQLDPSKFQRLIFGIMLILVALYRPNGLIPAKRKKNDLDAIKNSEFGKEKLGILGKLSQLASGKQS